MTTYIPTIGLEIHAELKTQTKMFCDSKNDLDETRPNVNVCPVCMGHPGTLPVPNKEAIRHVLRVGSAIGGTLAEYSEFDRKNYFYPDIPKGYQISQYKYPLVSGGMLADVAITRIHLEEDTARSVHTEEGSLVDFNRAGVPLMELVTEPVIHSAEQAGAFARELQLLLRTLAVSDADMEKGHMRVEVNISLAPESATTLGTKTEIKNLNSFRVAERAIAFEIERQTKLLNAGESVVQETRGWDEQKQKTFSQRIKESAHDYRYFPDPDIPKLQRSTIPGFSDTELKESLPELPWERRARYLGLNMKEEDVEMFVADSMLGHFIDSVFDFVSTEKERALAVNYTTSDIASLRIIEGNELPSAERFAELVRMIAGGDLSSRGGKDVLRIMVESGGDPQDIAEKEGLIQESDEGALKELAERLVQDNPEVVAEYKEGKENALQYLVGQAMKETKGSANPQILQMLFRELLQ